MKFTQKIKALAIASLTASSLAITSEAMATPITGGQTTVTVTADLGGLGLTPGIVEPASPVSLVPLAVAFPITGGSTDGVNSRIEHDGGVSLTAGDGENAPSVAIGNFLIDTLEATVFGDILGETIGSTVDFFAFGEGDELPGVELLITDTLANALIDVFGPDTPDLEGATFGYAVPDATQASAPATTMLLTMGLLGVIAAGRRRQR